MKGYLILINLNVYINMDIVPGLSFEDIKLFIRIYGLDAIIKMINHYSKNKLNIKL